MIKWIMLIIIGVCIMGLVSADFGYNTLDAPATNVSLNNVNSSEYWDNLDSPSDISTGDLTDDNTYVQVVGDIMTGWLNLDRNNISAEILHDFGDTKSIDLLNRNLWSGTGTTIRLDWDDGYATATDGTAQMNWNTAGTVDFDDNDIHANDIHDEAGFLALDLIFRRGYSDTGTTIKINWGTGTLYDYMEQVSIDWNEPGEVDVDDNDIILRADNTQVFWGASKDSSIYYNATDLLINPKDVGVGKLYVKGNLVVDNITAAEITATNVTYTSLEVFNYNVTGDMNVTGNVRAEGVVCGQHFFDKVYTGHAFSDTGNEVATRMTSLDVGSGITYTCIDCETYTGASSTCATDTNKWLRCVFKTSC